VKAREVVGENNNNPVVSFYAAAIGVMFLLFTSSGAAGALVDEAESGTLDRVLSSRVMMTSLLAGKVCYNTLLAFVQLIVMFLWGWAVFKLHLWSHIPGFVVMGVSTAFAVATFGILLASACKTGAQLGALSTLVILIMSSIGGSMFSRFLMPEAMQKAGLLTINAWAIDGFTNFSGATNRSRTSGRKSRFCSSPRRLCFLLRAGSRGAGNTRETADKYRRSAQGRRPTLDRQIQQGCGVSNRAAASFGQLIAALWHADPLVRMRADMPLAGLIVWTLIGVAGAILPPILAV
jgi:ABC-type transport system involved in cytochrome c biogenesis permease component